MIRAGKVLVTVVAIGSACAGGAIALNAGATLAPASQSASASAQVGATVAGTTTQEPVATPAPTARIVNAARTVPAVHAVSGASGTGRSESGHEAENTDWEGQDD